MFDNILPQLPFALYRDSTEVARKGHYFLFIQFVEQSARIFFSLSHAKGRRSDLRSFYQRTIIILF